MRPTRALRPLRRTMSFPSNSRATRRGSRLKKARGRRRGLVNSLARLFRCSDIATALCDKPPDSHHGDTEARRRNCADVIRKDSEGRRFSFAQLPTYPFTEALSHSGAVLSIIADVCFPMPQPSSPPPTGRPPATEYPAGPVLTPAQRREIP